jgi:hypothetical protein
MDRIIKAHDYWVRKINPKREQAFFGVDPLNQAPAQQQNVFFIFGI